MKKTKRKMTAKKMMMTKAPTTATRSERVGSVRFAVVYANAYFAAASVYFTTM